MPVQFLFRRGTPSLFGGRQLETLRLAAIVEGLTILALLRPELYTPETVEQIVTRHLQELCSQATNGEHVDFSRKNLPSLMIRLSLTGLSAKKLIISSMPFNDNLLITLPTESFNLPRLKIHSIYKTKRTGFLRSLRTILVTTAS
ncbi:TetR family transcriptional regulator C-terminal domain-containing protein [Paenibacillus sp. NPDC093718]|uniref:TetR family transcriptional regulator C-terminal domain-containing protein n=1 Tax=Paenibacillus sp. NPDC093718 TaxID=3390601 RepID=UPI003CFBF000